MSEFTLVDAGRHQRPPFDGLSRLVAYADEGQKLTQVIYWADTTGDPALDYKSAPVVWGTPAPASSTSQAPA